MKSKNLIAILIAIPVLLTVANAQPLPNYVPVNGLIGWWPFNGNASDESGNGHHGFVNGATLTNDRGNNPSRAFSFDGIDDYISIPKYTSLDSLSISFWVLDKGGYPNTNTRNPRYISSEFCNGGFAIFHNREYPANSGNNTLFFTTNRGGSADMQSSYQMPYNTLTFICVTYNGHLFNLYVNGVLDTSISITKNIIQGDSIYFGKSGCKALGLYTDVFNGVLDDIGIWNRSLSQLEINRLYNGCLPFVVAPLTDLSVNLSDTALFTVFSSSQTVSYQWQSDYGAGFKNLGDSAQYTGTTNDTLIIANTTSGNNNQPFRCIVTSNFCSDTTNAATLTVVNHTGIIDLSQSALFSVYPNPAEHEINIKANESLIGSDYAIYDHTGKVVLTGTLKSENTGIELDRLSTGIYLVSVGGDMKQSFKVVKP